MTTPLRVAVVGGGWAGLAAAVEAARRGHAVQLLEMAPMLGGRARRLPIDLPGFDGLAVDNGQHILIGAYRDTLRLLREAGVDLDAAFARQPLQLLDAQGRGLALPPGAALPAFVRGVLGARGWRRAERLALLLAASGWALRGFRCDAGLSVAGLTAGLPATLRHGLIEPLCVAALNTPAALASASVFLRVLRDALFSGRGGSDLLLPRVDLGRVWPDAAQRQLEALGATLQLGCRAGVLEREPPLGSAPAAATARWQLDGEPFDAVILACSAAEAARLAAPHAPAWAAQASALRHEPIVTVLVQAPGACLAAPMLALDARDDAQAPAQFVFDLGQLRGAAGLLAAVISGASSSVARGLDATAGLVRQQLLRELGPSLPGGATVLRTLCEKRATFLCTPALRRPPMAVAPGLLAAGDYIDGPYPATLEGAVRAGLRAARALQAGVEDLGPAGDGPRRAGASLADA